MRFRFPSSPNELSKPFPFRRDNRRPDGTWAADDATDDNIKGTSVDRYDPVWPRWKKTPPPDFEGEFVSDDPFFDIDEITQTAKFYPPGTPLVDKNLDGNPVSRQRVRDGLTGNLWRRRLLVAPQIMESDVPTPGETRPLQLAAAAPSKAAAVPRAQAVTPQTEFDDNDVDLLTRLIFAEAASQFRAPGAYLGIGNTVLNRVKARGFPKSLQDVILERTPNGVPQFASVGGRLWNLAANPAALTGEDELAYRAARGMASDLLYGSLYTDYDPTSGATYFYSSRPSNTPPAGFFTNSINSGRLEKTYEAGRPQYGDIFTFLRDTQ